VDSREQRSRIPSLLERMKVPFEVVELKVGDYIIGDVAVERKTIQDYIGSLSSGHLSQQLYELSFNFGLSYLLIEGLISEALMYRKMKRAPYISSLVGCSLKRAPDGKQGQIVTVNVENPWDSALFLRFLHDKLAKGEPRLPRMKKVKWNPDEQLVYILSSFPNVGEKRAKLILKRFKTLKGFTNASALDLASVSKVGRKLAGELYALVNLEYGGE